MTDAVRLQQVFVSFSGKQVIRNISMAIPASGLTFLLGRSGSGKTTLLRTINQLNACFPDCETQGQVMVKLGGKWINACHSDTAPEKLRRQIGMVFQTPNVLPLSIVRNITLPLEAALSLPASEQQNRVEQALQDVCLWDEVKDRLAKPALSLSGGQQQRLCLARTLAMQPEILLLDEPTASLDFRSAEQIEDLLFRLKTRCTLIVVSHSLRQAAKLADHVFVLRDGKHIEILPPDIFRNREALLAALGEWF